jgi:hypothetical protein
MTADHGSATSEGGAIPSLVPTAPCCYYCDDVLEFRPPRGLEPFALNSATNDHIPAWRHSNGAIYAGECRCDGKRHAYSHNVFGFLVCPTWRNDHCALQRRS